MKIIKQLCNGIAAIVTLTLTTLLLLQTFSHAQIKVTEGLFIDGYMRYRTEWDGKDFDHDTKLDSYSTLRTRIGLKAVNIVENTTMYLLLGDSRTLGFADPYISGSHIGQNKFDNNVGAVQAFIEIREFLRPDLTLKLGRMENNMGRGRFFGPGNWNVNGPRTYDGFSVHYAEKNASYRFFNFWGLGGDRHWAIPGENSDNYLTGLDLRFLEENLQFLLLWDRDNRRIFDITSGDRNKVLSQFTTMSFYKYSVGHWNFESDAAYQFGNRGFNTGKTDISAYMLSADLNYSIDNARKPVIGLAVDITSGDDGSDTGKSRYFSAEYFSKHGSQGQMDYFTNVLSKMNGLQDFILRFGFSPVESARTMIDLHKFRFQKAYNSAVDGSAVNNIGYEIDTKTDYTMREGLSMRYGLCLFLPSEDWQGKDTDLSLFSYLSFTLQF
ncbi:hypothetical protein ACFL67_03495 [candidate division KSB1 bacterium]